MYRIYLRDAQQYVYPESKTNTHSRGVALAAFGELIDRADLVGHKLVAIISHSNRQLAAHRYDHPEGTAQDWRGRLSDVPHPEGSHD